MKPRKSESSPHGDLFRMKLEQLINQRHELCRLARVIDWQRCEDQFDALFAEAATSQNVEFLRRNMIG